MKVLHVLRSPRAEGTVRLALDWLAAGELEQDVWLLEAQPAELLPALRERAAWCGTGEPLRSGWRKYPQLLDSIREVCRARRPDLLVCWVNGFSSWILLGARLAGVRRLITHAGNPPTRTWWGSVQTTWSLTVARLTGARMICCSNYVADAFRRAPGASRNVVQVVYNCAPVEHIRRAALEARRARSDLRPRIIMVATLEAHKDHATLLQAMPAIRREIPDLRLWLVGEGRLRQALERLASENGVSDAVEFLGSRHDVPALLGQSDLFVFSTTADEGLGTVLIEALAAGLPVLASDVPACREALGDGRWGRLVPPADATALAGAVVEELRRVPAPEPVTGQRDYLSRFQPSAMMASYLERVS